MNIGVYWCVKGKEAKRINDEFRNPNTNRDIIEKCKKLASKTIFKKDKSLGGNYGK